MTDEERAKPENWKLGFIYFNAADPKLVIPKRFGLGWTFNFARWQTWAFMVAVVVIAVAVKTLVQK